MWSSVPVNLQMSYREVHIEGIQVVPSIESLSSSVTVSISHTVSGGFDPQPCHTKDV